MLGLADRGRLGRCPRRHHGARRPTSPSWRPSSAGRWRGGRDRAVAGRRRRRRRRHRRRVLAGTPAARARPGHGQLAARRVRRARRASPPGGSPSPPPTRCSSTSTSACRRSIREAYRTFIRRELTDHVDLPPDRCTVPTSWADDLAGTCARYEALLAELGGVDLQLLGIGSDGHIGFNEPGRRSARARASRRSPTRPGATTPASSAPSTRCPRHVITQGLATIGDARHLVLMATGAAKAAPVAPAVEGPLTAMCPASVLQLHPHATVVVDEEAAAGLAHADYYRDRVRWQARLAAAVRLESWLRPGAAAGAARAAAPRAHRAIADQRLRADVHDRRAARPGAPGAPGRAALGLPRRRPAGRLRAGPGDVWELTATCGHRPGTPTTDRRAPSSRSLTG